MSSHAPRTTVLALVALLLPALAISAPPALEDVIPADTVMVVLVDDLPGLRREFPDLPLMRAWEDPAIQAAILHFSGLEALPDLPAWLPTEEQDGAGSDDPHLQLLNSLTGQVAFLLDMDALAAMHNEGEESEDHHLPAGFSLLAQIEGHEEAVTALLSTAGGNEPEDGSAAAMTLPADTWKIARGVLAISGTPEGLEALVAALEGKGEAAPLSTGSGYQTMSRHAPERDVALLVNLAPVMKFAQEAMSAGEDALPENPLGVTSQDLLRGLGLDVFRSAWFSLSLSPALTESTGGVTFSEERGLIRLAAFKPLPAGRRLPLPADTIDASTFMFDFSAMWQAALEITADISPVMGAAMEAQIVQMSAQLGIDLGKEIPGAFAGQFASASFLHPLPNGAEITTPEEFTKMMSQVWVAKLNPENRLEESIAALTPFLAATGMTVSTRTVDGHVFNILAPAGAHDTSSTVEQAALTTSYEDDKDALTGAWIIQNGYLVAGNARLEDMVAVLTGLDDKGQGVWGVKKVRASLDGLTGNAFAIQYQDTGRLMKGFMGYLMAAIPADEDGGTMMGPEEAGQLAEALARLIPVSVSAGYRSPGEMAFKARVFHGQP